MHWIGRIVDCILVAGLPFTTVLPKPEPGFDVRGQIVSSAPLVPTLMAELRARDDSSPEVVPVHADGTFVVSPTRQGMYSLRIIGSQGQVLWDGVLELRNSIQALSIELPDLPNSRASGATVSVTRLSHPVPSGARKAFNKGRAAVRDRKDHDALKYFRDAVKIDPEFADAYTELGGSLVAVGEFAEAVEQYQKAIELAPDHDIALYNLSVTLGKMQRWREAKDAARRTLSLDPGRPEILFILGVGLMFDNGNPIEALPYLLKAAPDIPKARLLAADILRFVGRPADAADQLREYLLVSTPEDPDLSKVRAWLMQLR